MRLVKAWAKAHSLNDASAGSLNSHALTLLVRGRCQALGAGGWHGACAQILSLCTIFLGGTARIYR